MRKTNPLRDKINLRRKQICRKQTARILAATKRYEPDRVMRELPGLVVHYLPGIVVHVESGVAWLLPDAKEQA